MSATPVKSPSEEEMYASAIEASGGTVTAGDMNYWSSRMLVVLGMAQAHTALAAELRHDVPA